MNGRLSQNLPKQIAKMDINNTKLHSRYTGIFAFQFFFVGLFVPFMIYNLITYLIKEFSLLHLIVIPIIALFSYLFYLAIRMTKAKTENEKLILKKLFRPEQSFEYDQIAHISNTNQQLLKFVTVLMKQADGSTESFVILYNKSIFVQNKLDTVQILLQLQRAGNIKKAAASR